MQDVFHKKLPFSAIVIGCNEANILENCLKSITFCDEILYVDLESADNSIEIARKYATEIRSHKKVPFGEFVQGEVYKTMKHDWILIIDPDEVISYPLYEDIVRYFSEDIDDIIGGVDMPWLFYFKKHALLGTPWGGYNKRLLLLNKHKYEIKPLVHAGRIIIPPYQKDQISYANGNVIHHYWMSGYKQLYEKHRRYLVFEPESRYNKGIKASVKSVLKNPFKSFRYAFFSTKGYKDGLIGLFLSLFWVWYQFQVELRLYKYQNRKK